MNDSEPTFACCVIVGMEPIATHPTCGHMWLIQLANGYTQVAFGHEIRIAL
ncbi:MULTISPECIES: hypothetical protein [Rhodococcus]|uniref:hypothetical protein n=1 Tax=Rhodococcus TaxID=1827 RepID=UPI000AE97D40|nr:MULTISPECIES: hypothetical protein [Rhodococcus]MCF8784162.1 hypothetical protein [Rhodococcus ruber]UIR36918.1 hypothetical protein LZP97_25630 [Rhodococcus sp. DMF-1]UIR39746.1 hypothetical protein LZP97_27055 [Rhodococcus sp. DMF-1]